MHGRISITFDVQGTPHTFRKQFTGPEYLAILLRGRGRVKEHTKALEHFTYEIAYRNSRMEWALMECGNEITLHPERGVPHA